MSKWLAAACLVALWSPSPAGAAAQATAIIDHAIDGYIRPATVALHDRAAVLAADMTALCDAPSADALTQAQSAFADIVTAWGKVEFIRLGPVTAENRLERILYWPDRKGLGLRQVQTVIAGEDPTAADPKSLAGKSIAMQGLGALEFVLYGAGAGILGTKKDSYRCRYGQAIAANVERIAEDIRSGWADPDGFAKTWSSPGPDNPIYRSGTESVTDLVELMVNGLELVRDVRLNGFLGQTAKADKPRQALYWRSGLTTAALAANVEGIAALFDASKLGGSLDAENAYIAQSIDFETANALGAARAAGSPIAGALADPARRAKLAYFSIVTTSLSDLIGTRLSAAFGLTAGFSSLDGD